MGIHKISYKPVVDIIPNKKKPLSLQDITTHEINKQKINITIFFTNLNFF